MLKAEELEQIKKLLEENNKLIRKDVKEDIQASEDRVTQKTREEIKASENRMIKKIEDTSEDTIHVLSELIETGYQMHNKRIEKIEDELDLPHPKNEN